MSVSSETLSSIAAPARLETRLGMLEFVDGVPSAETVETVYDHLDFVHGLNAAAADADGSTTITIGPERPSDVPEGNWIQTIPGKGWFPVLRLYSPLDPLFDKTRQPSEIEIVG